MRQYIGFKLKADMPKTIRYPIVVIKYYGKKKRFLLCTCYKTEHQV